MTFKSFCAPRRLKAEARTPKVSAKALCSATAVNVTAASGDGEVRAPTSGLNLLDLDMEEQDGDTPMTGTETFGSGAKRSATDSAEAPDQDSVKKARQPLKATLPTVP